MIANRDDPISQRPPVQQHYPLSSPVVADTTNHHTNFRCFGALFFSPLWVTKGSRVARRQPGSVSASPCFLCWAGGAKHGHSGVCSRFCKNVSVVPLTLSCVVGIIILEDAWRTLPDDVKCFLRAAEVAHGTSNFVDSAGARAMSVAEVAYLVGLFGPRYAASVARAPCPASGPSPKTGDSMASWPEFPKRPRPSASRGRRPLSRSSSRHPCSGRDRD